MLSPEDLALRHPGVRELMKYFEWTHLRTDLQEISKPCAELAEQMVEQIPDNAELTAGLRKLLEAKDCFVRARL